MMVNSSAFLLLLRPRFGILARYAGAIWLAATTPRGAATRIISVRRATIKEAGIYDRINAQR